MTVVVRHREHGWLRDAIVHSGDYTADFDEAVGYPDSDHAWQVMELAEIPRDGHQVIELGAARAVAQMLAIKGSQYVNGTGRHDGPSSRNGLEGYDCVGAVCRAYRHLDWIRSRPGYAIGCPTMSGVLHPDTWRWDGTHERELVERVATPAIGDLLCKPNTYAAGVKVGYSHVEIVVDVLALEWEPVDYDRELAGEAEIPPWHLLLTAGARGPNRRKPAVLTSAMTMWRKHDAKWLRKPGQRTWLLRPVTRQS